MNHATSVLRRIAARFAAVATIVLVIVGCGSSSSGSPPAPTVPPPPVGGPPPPVSPPPPPTLGADEAQTTEGVVRGSILPGGGLRAFRGIRFAAPPVGDLRFSPPQPPPRFTGVRDATQFGDVCIQIAGPGTTGSEDCLFLNIWSHTDTVRPVIVFLHGGGANGAGGNSAVLDGEDLAREAEVVVVTLNRRLGALGYLAVDELVAESDNDTAGNYAIQDTIAALQWLRANIAAFNGDPNRIMLAGQSAGGGVTCGVLSSPATRGLINSAALMSPACPPFPVLSADVGIATTRPFIVDEHREVLEFFSCDTTGDAMACLRALPAEDIVLAEEFLEADFGNIIDGVVITADRLDAVATGVAGDIPLIAGSTADEMAKIFGTNFVADDAEYREFLEAVFEPPLSDELYALYPTADFATANDAVSTLIGDILFNCPAEWLVSSAQTGAPAYLYEFGRGFDNGGSADQGAFHTIDVTHLFGTFSAWGYAPDSQAISLSTAMRVAWAGLVNSPANVPQYNVGGASPWPAYTTATPQYVRYGETPTTRTSYRNGKCEPLAATLSD
jgi:para-nitrobenzyl esterase